MFWWILLGLRTGKRAECLGRAWMAGTGASWRPRRKRIRKYERATYYAGNWDPAYEKWVQMLAGHVSRAGTREGGVGLGPVVRHDLHAAGRL